jgi:hypothetical protein
MVCEARHKPELSRSAKRASLKFGATMGSGEVSGHLHLHPRSRPRKDGTRRITVEARSDVETLIIDLTAGEAVELMFELGAALEQAARDQRRGLQDSCRLEAISGGRA